MATCSNTTVNYDVVLPACYCLQAVAGLVAHHMYSTVQGSSSSSGSGAGAVANSSTPLTRLVSAGATELTGRVNEALATFSQVRAWSLDGRTLALLCAQYDCTTAPAGAASSTAIPCLLYDILMKAIGQGKFSELAPAICPAGL